MHTMRNYRGTSSVIQMRCSVRATVLPQGLRHLPAPSRPSLGQQAGSPASHARTSARPLVGRVHRLGPAYLRPKTHESAPNYIRDWYIQNNPATFINKNENVLIIYVSFERHANDECTYKSAEMIRIYLYEHVRVCMYVYIYIYIRTSQYHAPRYLEIFA